MRPEMQVPELPADLKRHLLEQFGTNEGLLNKLRAGGVPDELLEPLLELRTRVETIDQRASLSTRNGIRTTEIDTIGEDHLLRTYHTVAAFSYEDREKIEYDLLEIGELTADLAAEDVTPQKGPWNTRATTALHRVLKRYQLRKGVIQYVRLDIDTLLASRQKKASQDFEENITRRRYDSHDAYEYSEDDEE